MPSQKGPQNTPPLSDDEQNSDDPLEQLNQSVQDQPQEHQSDSDGSAGASSDSNEYITIRLADIRKEVQCPIFLGKMSALSCRTHCTSHHSVRDDPNYDALISALYPYIDKYEEEEFTFHEEERARNNEIQDSIAQTLHRKLEARGKKCSSAKATTSALARRS